MDHGCFVPLAALEVTMFKLLVSAALIAAGSPAFAQDVPSASVRYADLNLASPEGVAEFDRRIARAVTTVCPEAIGPYVQEIAAANACRATTLASVKQRRDALLATARTGPEASAVASR
jgi:UrcA family protein